MKKIRIIFGVLFALSLGGLIAIPFFVNVDQYRPQLIQVANQHLNGKLDIGKLSLSLWGQIRIGIDGVKLTDAAGREILGVKDAYFHLPFSSVFSGSPELTLRLSQPHVNLLKTKGGKMNLLTLMKSAESKPSESSEAPSVGRSSQWADPSKSEEKKGGSLPSIVTRARLGVELNHAQLNYQDEGTGLAADVSDLNLKVQDISLSHPMQMEIWADLNTRLGKTLMLQGPARLAGKAVPDFREGKFNQVSLQAKLDMDSVQMSVSGLFEKKKGVPSSVDLDLTASENEMTLSQVVARFHNAEVKLQGKVTQLSSASAGGAVDPVLHFDVTTNAIQMKPWVELVPLLKEYDLGGSAQFNSQIRGPLSRLDYQAKLRVDSLTAKAPKFKTQPILDGEVSVIRDQVDKIAFVMKAPGNELKINGRILSLAQPKLEMKLSSVGMDLDQLFDFPSASSQGAQSQTHGQGEGSGSGSASKSSASEKGKTDYDALLAPLRENETIAKMGARILVDLKMLKAQGIQVSDLGCQMNFTDLTLGFNDCRLKVFSGLVSAESQMQLKPKTPTYQFQAQVSHLDLSQAVASKMALFKNTVTGTAHFKMKGQGASFNPEVAMNELNTSGTFKIDQAVFTTIDIAAGVSESLNKAFKEIDGKVPAVKGKSVKIPSHGSKYEFISSHFTIEKGKFSAPDFLAKAAPQQGLDLRGATQVGLQDYSLETQWDVMDTYNLTGLRDLSVEVSGTKVEHLLTEGSAPVRFPFHVGCTIKAPCYSSTEMATYFARVALNNLSHAAVARGKEELKKQAERLFQQAAPALKDQFKGLFH